MADDKPDSSIPTPRTNAPIAGTAYEALQACEVPLIEQLRSIPKEFRAVRPIQWAEDGRETGHQFIPVGHMMHRAADELEAVRPSQVPQTDYCWLIERAGPQYATGSIVEVERWTKDPYKAVRMPTESAAFFVLSGLRLWEDYEGAQHNLVRTVEHGFDVAPPSPRVAQDDEYPECPECQGKGYVNHGPDPIQQGAPCLTCNGAGYIKDAAPSHGASQVGMETLLALVDKAAAGWRAQNMDLVANAVSAVKPDIMFAFEDARRSTPAPKREGEVPGGFEELFRTTLSPSSTGTLTNEVAVTALNAWAAATEMGECLLDRLDQAAVLRHAATALSARGEKTDG